MAARLLLFGGDVNSAGLLLFIPFPAPEHPGRAVPLLLPTPSILGWARGAWEAPGGFLMCRQVLLGVPLRSRLFQL